jgi:lysophospholipase L1-like esterase
VAKGTIPEPVRPEWLEGSLAATTPGQFYHPWPDTLPPPNFVAEPSTLHDAKVLDWFEREAEGTGLDVAERDGGISTSTPTSSGSHDSTAAPQPSAPAVPSPAVTQGAAPCRLLAVGDSLTDPQSNGGGYLASAQERCSCDVTNIAKGGAMVNQMRRSLLAHLAETKNLYTHVVIFGGVNDLYSDRTAQRTVKKITADLEVMYRAARSHGASVVGVTVAPWGGFRRYFTELRWQHTLELNRWLRKAAPRQLDAVVDAEQLLGCGVAERLCARYAAPYRDGLHFGPLGHRRLAEALVRALGPRQCPPTPDDGPAPE